MSLVLIVSVIWVLAATVTAMLPMRFQYGPGLTLLIAAPVLIIWLGMIHGWWLSALAVLAFGSMFRHPLRYLARRALGRPVDRPVDGTSGKTAGQSGEQPADQPADHPADQTEGTAP